MKIGKRALIIVFIYFLFFNFLYSFISHKKIDDVVREAMKQFDVVGAGVVIVKDGRIYHIKGYGFKEIGKPGRVDEKTLFAIASNTKAFTSAALAILVSEGKIRWQTKVIDIIPEFRMYNPYVTENFMIEDLLTHRSGLPLGAGDLMFFPDGADFTINDVLKVFQFFKPTSPFRAHFDYDNLLYFVAGEIVKRVSGMPWEKYVEERIFKPLHMKNTYSNFFKIKNKNYLASPHSMEGSKLRVIEHYKFCPEKINGAAGGIYSSVEDLSKWLNFNLNGGRIDNGKRLFSKKDMKKIWTIHTVLDFKPDKRYNTHFSGYGLGWVLKDVRGFMMVSHTGGLPGFLSKTTLIPDIGLGIVVLTNTSPGGSPFFRAVTNTIVDSFLKLTYKDWIEEYREKIKKKSSYAEKIVKKVWKTVRENKNTLSKKELEKFKGRYRDNWFGCVDIVLRKGNLLFLSKRSPKLKGQMFYYKANTFVVKWDYRDMNADAFLIFNLNEEGKPVSFRMKGISPDIDFSFDFQHLYFKRVK